MQVPTRISMYMCACAPFKKDKTCVFKDERKDFTQLSFFCCTVELEQRFDIYKIEISILSFA